MSRSYKKAVHKYAPTGTWGKKKANRKVRRTKNIPDGKAYRKVFSTWDVHDCIWDGRFAELDDSYIEYKTGDVVLPEFWIAKKKNSKKINGCWYITK